MLNIFEDDLSKEKNDTFVYADSASRYQVQLPLAIPWYTQSGVTADDLYNDDDSRYVIYSSGVNETIITSRLKDRFGGLSLEVISGVFSGYVQVYDESTWDPNPPTIAGPYTVSGDTSGDVLYISTYYEEALEVIEAIPFSGAGSYKIVFPKPVVCRSFRLVHSGDSAYQISRIIPRRAVQAFDLEVNAIKAYHVSAELIETIALEVSDSIVIGPDLIGDKTIDGRKILDGTVSGVLITPGTITANEIAVSGITASRLNVTSLSAINASTGSLNVDDVITISGGEIDAGLTRITQNGITVGNFASFLPSVNRLNILGSGEVDDVVGMAFYNASFSETIPLFSIQIDSVNAIEFNNNQSNQGLINFNFPEDSNNTSVQVYNGNLNILNGDFFVYNPAGTAIVAVVDKTGAAEFRQVLAAAGSLANPAYSFSVNPDTGMYAVTNGLAFSINGEVGAVLSSNRVLSVNGSNQNGQITVEVPDGTARTALTLRQLNDASNVINFVTNGVGAAFPVQTSALGTYYGKVRVAVNGTTRWLALYNT
jgi:hypothetical protein